jgi:hypothetical protein
MGDSRRRPWYDARFLGAGGVALSRWYTKIIEGVLIGGAVAVLWVVYVLDYRWRGYEWLVGGALGAMLALLVFNLWRYARYYRGGPGGPPV